jgi:alpha-1,2-mannosyltransferase
VLWILASVAFALLCYQIPTLVTAVLWPLWNNPNVLQTDFHYYYEAARRFSGGGPLYLASDDVIAGFAYPPPAIVPFVALSKLPLGAALLLFTLASCAALLVSIRWWFGYLRRDGIAIARPTEIALMVIAIALGPSYMNIMIGQVNAFVLASAVGFVWFATELPPFAAVLLASGIWLKIYPVTLGAIGAWDFRSWKALAWTIVALIGIAIALLPLVPVSAYQAFVSEVLPARIDKTAIHVTNQSLVAFLERFRYAPEEFLYWTGEEAKTVGGFARLMSGGVAAAMLITLWRSAKAGRGAKSTAGLIALIAVVAPLGWGHTYVMVLPLVMLQLIAMRTAPASSAVIVFLSVLALMLPAGRHLPLDSAPGWLQNLVYSRYLIATLFLLVLDLDTRPQRA